MLGLALSLAACGDAGDDDDSGSDVEVEENAADDFDDGTRMKELAEAGKVMVGVKYDQPGLGFKGAADDLPSGFDVEIAKLLVADLGIDPEDASVVTYEETISDNREPFLLQGKVDLVLASYSITDERRAEVGQTGPYFLTGQQLLVPSRQRGGEHRRPGRPGGLLGHRVDVHRPDQRAGRQGHRLRQLLGVRPEGAGRHRAGHVHRRLHPRLATPHRTRANLKVVGEPFSEERIGVGYSKESPEMCEWINDVLEDAFEDWLLGGCLRADSRAFRCRGAGRADARRVPEGLW